MNAQLIFDKAKQGGLTLSFVNGGLKVSGDAATFEQMRGELIEHKPELLAYLVERWLREKLDCIQSAKVLEIEAAHLGYSTAELDAARLTIGEVQVVPCLGVNYWRLASARVLH